MNAPAGTPLTMQAIVQAEYGSADVLRLEEIERPTIGKDEVLIRIHAAGLDRGTWHQMAGLPYLFRVMGIGLRAPKNPVPGLDVAGTVEAVGNDVTRFAIGDEVYGIGKGSFAEYASARADKLARKPAETSASINPLRFPSPGSRPSRVFATSGRRARPARTDRRCIGRRRHLRRADRQGARSEVTGVCSTAKVELVRSLGADHVIDYTHDDFANSTERYDMILDIGGNSPLPRLRRALTAQGTLVIVGGEGGGRIDGGMGRQLRAVALSSFLRQRLTMKVPKENYADLERLTALIEAGKLTPTIDKTYPLREVPNAMRHLEAGRARGKLVITLIPTPRPAE